MYNAKNKTISLGEATFDYAEFGTGTIPLVILPGLGDGLKTVKGMASPLSLMYRKLAKCFRVYIFSRKNDLTDTYTTEMMASDQNQVLDALGIKKYFLMGVSQGGMIAQHLAIEHSQKIHKLALVVTASRSNETIKEVVSKWIDYGKKDDYKSLVIDTTEHTYSNKKLKYYRLLYPIVTKFGKPKNFQRFLIQANSCLSHDAHSRLGEIAIPTLVIGGSHDKVVGNTAATELASQIPAAELLIYEDLGHGAYEEQKDFQETILAFFDV